MSALQSQVIQSLDGLSEDNLRFLLDLIQRFMKPSKSEAVSNNMADQTGIRKIGIFEHENLYDKDYAMDEHNEEIAKLFGVCE